jgi:hypothetical protein
VTPRPPLIVSADKAYDSEKVRQQIKDNGAVPVIPSRSNSKKAARCPRRIYRLRHKVENYFWIGAGSRPGMTSLPATFWPQTTSSHHSIGSGCESRP